MKAYVKRETKYFKTIYEQAVAGEYEVTLSPNTCYVLELVGAGGGPFSTYQDRGNGGWTSINYGGGAGAFIKTMFTTSDLDSQIFKIAVGSGGAYLRKSSGNQGATSDGIENKGGDTILQYNDTSLLTAQGGLGGIAKVRGGDGGDTEVNELFESSVSQIVSLKTTSGSNGSYSATFGTTGWASVSGGLSVYDYTQTGYGAGGGSKGSSPYNGTNGYCRIMQQTTEDDYEFKEEIVTYKLPRTVDVQYFQTIFEQATPGTYSISVPSGNYVVELVGAGGGCAGCRWASNVGNGNTMLSGGSGAYFKGILHVPAGTYTITVGAGKPAVTADVNTLTTAEAGGDTSFDSLITAGGGQGGQASFSTRIAGVGGVCSINTSIIENIDTRNGNTGREAGNAIYTFTTVTGGVSAYDNSTTGYGAGGGYPDGGIDGYCKIMQQTTEDDSTTSEIKYTYYGII